MKTFVAILMLLIAAPSYSAILSTAQPFSYERASQVRKGMTPEQVSGLYLH